MSSLLSLQGHHCWGQTLPRQHDGDPDSSANVVMNDSDVITDSGDATL